MNFWGMAEVGVLTGLLIGLTGMGSGSLLTPLLILLGGMPPTTAVGTSLVFSFASKFYGSLSFYRQGQVRTDIARDLSYGGVPGILIGTFIIRYLGIRRPAALDFFMMRAIAVTLVVIALLMLLRLVPWDSRPRLLRRKKLPFEPEQRRGLIVLTGFAAGFSITITSIGAGTILIPAMLVLDRLKSAPLVGTTVFVGAVFAAVAGISHASLGHVSWPAVAALLCGAVPAIWLASRSHARLPRQVPDSIIAVVSLALAFRILSS